MASVLARIGPEQVVEHPFPHVAIENAVDAALCDRLLRDFPPLEAIVDGRPQGSNEKFYLTAERARRTPGLAPVWRNAIRDNLGAAQWRHLLRIFGHQLEREYPQFRRVIGDPRAIHVGVRDIDRFAEMDVLTDCKALFHTPVTGDAVAERGPHIKNFRSLFLAYLYLRPEDDTVPGGDHVLYAPRPGAGIALGPRQTTSCGLVEPVRSVPFRHNTLVVFMNTRRSFQANTPRPPSPHLIRALHASVYLRQPLFSVPLQPGVERVDFAEWAPPPRRAWMRRLMGA